VKDDFLRLAATVGLLAAVAGASALAVCIGLYLHTFALWF
jgi:hypothetical protein